MSQTMTDTLDAWGWEVHFEGGRSDKFYRSFVFEVPTDVWVFLVQYGRRGTTGQPRLWTFASQSAALTYAQENTDTREDKGYQETRALTRFTIGSQATAKVLHAVETVQRGDSASVWPGAWSALCAEFKIAAGIQGTELPGADQ